MNNNRNIVFGLGALIGLIVSQAIIKTIGIDNLSVQVIDTILVIISIGIAVGTYKNKTSGLGMRYNIIVAILTIVMSMSVAGMITIFKCYPQLTSKYGKFFFVSSTVSFFTLILYIIIKRVIYERKSKL